jgi:hypothetical protein
MAKLRPKSSYSKGDLQEAEGLCEAAGQLDKAALFKSMHVTMRDGDTRQRGAIKDDLLGILESLERAREGA